MKNDKTKKNIIIVGILLLLIIVILGVSYAVFSYTGRGEKVNTITSGAISMSYEESDNVITMDGALPTTDATGTKRLKKGEYFDFTISSTITGNTNINYEISAKEVGEGTIDGSNIKLYLTKLNDDNEEELMEPEVYNEETSENTYTGRPAGEMSLYASSMSSSESNRYRLRMYVDENYNPQGDGGNLTFSVRINVYGKSGDKMPIQEGHANEVLLNQDNIGENGSTYNDGEDTFITGTDPNNYIWYSGKLWRAVLVNNEAKTTKLVTEWNISAIPYNSSNQSSFDGSHMESWLNDESVDGFLGNLRDYENFIVTDAKWNATMDSTGLGNITRPSDNGTIVTDTVGLLNMYEYQSSSGKSVTSYINSYLNNGLSWWTLTSESVSNVRYVTTSGNVNSYSPSHAIGFRPSINLKSNIRIISGTGTVDNPYRLEGDNDRELSGTMLKHRFSGEYIRFGSGENNLYRIVSHENGTGTKITSTEPLRDSEEFVTSSFGNNTIFSSTNTIGLFLNGEYLTNYVGNDYVNMIEDNTTWYLGTVGAGASYKLAKYTDTNMSSTTSSTTSAKVGLLRLGELMAGQFKRYAIKGGVSSTRLTTDYWILTPYSSSIVRIVNYGGSADYYSPSNRYGIRPTLNLKENVIITGGEGTKENPFQIELESTS